MNATREPPPGWGGIPWCGPSALSAATGRSYLECDLMLRDVIGQREAIVGSWPEQMVMALLAFGYRPRAFISKSIASRPTVAAWQKRHADGTTYIVGLAHSTANEGHWIVMQGDQLCDNGTRCPISFDEAAPYRRRYVDCYIAVTR